MLSFKRYFLNEETGTRVDERTRIVMFPGSFKPPHKGHIELINKFRELAGPEGQVNVIVTDPSPKSRRYTKGGKYIPANDAADILKTYVNALGYKNVNITTAKNAVSEVYDYIREYAAPGDHIIVGVGGKGGDAARYQGLDKHTPENVKVDIEVADVVSDESGTVSASNFRDIIDNLDVESLKLFVPDELVNNEDVINFVFSKLSNLPSD